MLALFQEFQESESLQYTECFKECPKECPKEHSEECSKECPEEHPEDHPEECPEECPDESHSNESSSQESIVWKTTSNLLKHLKRHKAKVPELRESSVEEGIEIVKHNRSFLIIEDDELRKILTYLKPCVVVLSADIIKIHIMNNVKEKHEWLQKSFQKIPGCILITTDIWTTLTNE
ncbi:10992_t:CDS:2, partial [Cetraspora pellucida]